MEAGFLKADSTNLPEVNGFMVAEFFVSNADFYGAEFRNVKTSVSSRQTYGDDAVGYVQLRRDSGQCIIKCKICPEHRVHTKSYAATMIVNERDSKIEKVECHDCAASEGGCKHSVAFLMWVHRRSEEPSCTSVECYWKKARLAQVGSTIKYVTSKDLGKSAASASIPAVVDVLSHFIAEAQNRKIKNCQLLHQNTYINENPLSLHYLIIDFRVNECDLFLKKLHHYFPNRILKIVKEIPITQSQFKTKMWHELRYGRITASKAYEVSNCKTSDGSLVSAIMGARAFDTKFMKRGRNLEDAVKLVVEKRLKKKIQKCGLIISRQHPYIAGSPDGICDNAVIEIKCPSSEI